LTLKNLTPNNVYFASPFEYNIQITRQKKKYPQKRTFLAP